MMLLMNFKRSTDGMKKNKIIIVLRVFLGLLLWFLSFKGLGWLVSLLIEGKMPEVLKLVAESMLIPYTVSLGMFFLVVIGIKKSEIKGEKKADAKMIIKAFIIQTGFSMPVIIFVNVIAVIAGFQIKGITAEELFGKYWIFYAILLLIFNPIFEELLFRKFVLERLLVLGEIPAILLTSFFFALPHLYSVGVPIFFGTFIIAAVWGFIRVKTGKMWPVVLLHCMFNIYGSYLLLALSRNTLGTLLLAAFNLLIFPAAALVISIVYLISKKKKTVSE